MLVDPKSMGGFVVVKSSSGPNWCSIGAQLVLHVGGAKNGCPGVKNHGVEKP